MTTIAEVKMMLGDAAIVADSTRGLMDPDVTVGPDRRGGGAVAGGHRSGAAEKTGDVIDHYKLRRWARAGSGPCGWPSRAR